MTEKQITHSKTRQNFSGSAIRSSSSIMECKRKQTYIYIYIYIFIRHERQQLKIQNRKKP